MKKQRYEHAVTIKPGKLPIGGTEIYIPVRDLRLQEAVCVVVIGILLGVILMVVLA